MTRKIDEIIAYAISQKEFEDWLGITGIGNARQHIESIRKELEKEKVKVAEFIKISQTDNEGTAKKRFRALMRKQKAEHDLTLIQEDFHKLSTTWLDGVIADKKKSVMASAPMSLSRAKLEHEALIPYFIKLHEICATKENGESLLSQFVRDYKRMGKAQFVALLYKFVEDIIDYEEDEHTEVALVEAISFCKGHYPEQLLKDFTLLGEELGSISESRFSNFEVASCGGAETAEKAALRILTLALYRAEGNEGEPTIGEENTYAVYLSTEKNCPWGEEWVVRSNTRLTDILNKLKLEKVAK